MPNPDYAPLPEALRPLLNKFYRAHNSPMRSASDGQPWVARQGEIIGGLSLTPIAQGHWLTGLFVAPSRRGQGIAAQLVQQALGNCCGPVWLFCHPELRGFYERLGFHGDPALPQLLAERLARYSRSKPMIALGIEPLVRSTAQNV
ncbi:MULTISPECIES: GNAT family N-acetyltransferase [unclassified Pseudomonas]|uniref:GNAT family N-acetyltransferase n=1 Tax=unclassified Pseudomonas TaxID=196821 RepID=UPI00128D5CCA|nr:MULTISPECIES: GNAT family N-acetyltransferase [unclassified Pseudomonas]MPQ70282.1 GNAT family N-acetyltransferase [Pseudomonas sp. MWU12-2323]